MTDPTLIEQRIYYGRPILKPTVGTWIRHILLLGLTFCTATIAGTLFPFGPAGSPPDIADPQSASEFFQLITSLPTRYALFVVGAINDLLSKPEYLIYGL